MTPIPIKETEFVELLQYEGNHQKLLLIHWLYLGLVLQAYVFALLILTVIFNYEVYGTSLEYLWMCILCFNY